MDVNEMGVVVKILCEAFSRVVDAGGPDDFKDRIRSLVLDIGRWLEREEAKNG